MQDTCRLCESNAQLQLSHIIPRFVFDWLKRTSLGAIRCTDTPNRRVQDGEKQYLLCHDCEQRFSSWEQSFAKEVFTPLHKDRGKRIYCPYREWALKFAVSVSWRVLTFFKQSGLSHFSDAQLQAADEALATWADFLLEKRSNPGVFEQHVIPLDILRSHTVPELSPFINRYILRAIDMDPICTDKSAMVYVKMCKVMLIGFIQMPKPKQWKGTKLHVRRGKIGSKKYVVPENLAEYISSKANRAAAALASLSPRQQRKIDEIFREKAGQLPNSQVLRAMTQDVALFGRDAFAVTQSANDEEDA